MSEKLSLKQRLEKAGISLARAAFGGAVAVLTGAGTLANYNGDKALGIALLIGAGAGILRLIQTWIPGLTTGNAVADSFIRAALSSFAVFAGGVLDTPSPTLTRAALDAAIVAAITAGARSVQGAATEGESFKG